jgi:GST-like protein
LIDVYFWPTGNGKKITIMCEECSFDYKVVPVNIGKGDQFTPEFLKLNPNGKMPVIVDHDFPGGPISIFESEVIQWVYWQVGGLGPIAGQAHHFLRYAPQKVEYAMNRFRKETARLYGVLDKQLEIREFIVGDYSIADIAAWPWIARYEWQEQNLDDFPNVKRWFEVSVGGRPAVKRGAAVGADWQSLGPQMSDEDKKRLFNLTDEDLKKAST